MIVGAYEKETKGTVVTHRVHVGDSILIETKNNVQSTLFLIKDHLGSLVTVIDSLGAVKEQLSYDPWGKRRASTGASINLLTLQTLYTDRGYTGHLHADGVGLIHMNGRMYDPILARFISADPLIQSPNNLQSLNRYSYVMNNPLSYTDPTGYSWSKFRDKWLKPIAAIAISIYMPQMLMKAYGMGMMTASAITGAAMGYAQTGTLQGAFIGAWTGAAFNAAGTAFKGPLSNTLAHATIGGISSAASGGSFKNGFIASGISAAASNSGFTENASGVLSGGKATPAGNVVTAALIGGVAAKSTGGNFAQGAVMAAMAQALNDGLHRLQDDYAKNMIMDGEHYYTRERMICSVGVKGCSESTVFENMLKDGAYPGQREPMTVGSNRKNSVDIVGPWGEDHIHTYVDVRSKLVTNVTYPNHILNPGFVQREVLTIDSKIYIRTTGGGSGYFGKINNQLKNNVWEPMDQKVIKHFQ